MENQPEDTDTRPRLDRRRFLTTGVIGAGAGAAAALLPAAATAQTGVASGTYLPTGFPAPGLGSVREAILPLQMSEEPIVTTAQPVYVLPRDHKFHAGQFYATNHFWEWHYWSGFCKDAAGNEYALFFGTDPVGYNRETGGYGFLPAVLSISPIKAGVKYHYFDNFPTLEAKVPDDASSPADFQYLISNENGRRIDERYYAADDRWVFNMRSDNPADPWCEFDIRSAAPGYIPRTPTGMEEEGVNDAGRYNPQTMHGLSYYYIAPNMPFTGKMGVNGQEVEVEGSVWFEHQWGNIKGLDQENARWRWFSFRFDDGRRMAFRHWMLPPDNLPVHTRNHYMMYHPDGLIEYGYPNREMRFTPTGTFTAEGTDVQWSPEGLMETPFGNFFLKAMVRDSAFISKTGMTFWEGPMEMLQDNSGGARIGLAYCEEYFQPRGGPERMRILEEQDLALEVPVAGLAPKP